MTYIYHMSSIKPVYGEEVMEYLSKRKEVFDKCLTEEDLYEFEDSNSGNIFVYAWKSVNTDERGTYVPYKFTFNGTYGKRHFWNDFSQDRIITKK